MSDSESVDPIGSKDDDRGIDTEQDVPVDDATAASRATGGDDDSTGSDSESTTGTGESGEFVGRVSGQDEGYAGMTGAEARALPETDGASGALRDSATGGDGAKPLDETSDSKG